MGERRPLSFRQFTLLSSTYFINTSFLCVVKPVISNQSTDYWIRITSSGQVCVALKKIPL